MKGAIRRRLAIAGVALIVAAGLLRTQVALALVYRGDDVLARADARGATRYYRRALLLDPGSIVATERLAFAAFLQDDPVAMRAALCGLSRSIAGHGGDTELRKDRALLELRLGRREDAARDWIAIGKHDGDARSLAFAGILEFRDGRCWSARRLLRAALSIDPRLAIAQRRIKAKC